LGEIKSAIDVAQEHAEAIKTAKGGFDSDNKILRGEQRNDPTENMRRCIDSMVSLCKSIGRYLAVDAENVKTMAKEFELWDQSGAVEK